MPDIQKTTIKWKALRNVAMVHLPLENGKNAFPLGGTWPIKRFYESMTAMGPITLAEYDEDIVHTTELLSELPDEFEPTGDADMDKALKASAITKALERRSLNSEVRMWIDRYIANGTIQIIEETNE